MENIAYRREKLPLVSVIAHSHAMREVMSMARRVAVGDSTVLLRGETGVGKEVMARYIHQTSRRRNRPLVSVNCAALDENLLNSELFGHEKGSFTGATEQRLGRFELADGGSIFLDEIGDAAPSVQARLLRVLQERTFERLGGNEMLRTDVRVLAASNRDLEEFIAEKRFREDLFYRLNVVPITIPPLRDRIEDVEPLARYFTGRIAAELGVPSPYLSRDALDLLAEYRWPGNVRELENVLERAIVVCTDNMITPSDLPVEVRSRGLGPEPDEDILEDTLHGREKQMIEQALERSRGNQNEAARILGISRYKLRYRIRKFGIKLPR
jgi:transcriptional regulator with PAS, ATPase and Fis domain